jgi:hypothetical protein
MTVKLVVSTEIRNPAKFPRALAASQKGQCALWELGDAVLSECGVPPEHGVNDGSRAALQACAEELLELGGVEFTAHYLSKARQVAYNFPPESRVGLLAFAVHQVAGSPEKLKNIVEAVPEGQRITVRVVEAAVREASLVASSLADSAAPAPVAQNDSPAPEQPAALNGADPDETSDEDAEWIERVEEEQNVKNIYVSFCLGMDEVIQQANAGYRGTEVTLNVVKVARNARDACVSMVQKLEEQYGKRRKAAVWRLRIKKLSPSDQKEERIKQVNKFHYEPPRFFKEFEFRFGEWYRKNERYLDEGAKTSLVSSFRATSDGFSRLVNMIYESDTGEYDADA